MPSETQQPSLSRRDLLAGTAAALTPGFVAAQTTGRRPAGEGQRATRPFDLEQFVDDCRNASRDTEPQGAVQEALARAIARPREVLTAVGDPEQAGIQTLYRSNDLTILNIVWAPLMQLMPHEHNMWAVSGIYTGREDNILWERSLQSIAATRAVSFAEGQLVALPQDAIHSVINPIQKLTGAIHVYGGDFFEVPRSEWDPEKLEEYAWDIDKAVRLFKESNDRFLAWESTQTCA